MCEGYILEWLDTLITVSLDPAKIDFNTSQDMHHSELVSKIADEKNKIQTFLKNIVYAAGDEKKIKLLINQCHSDLVILLEQAMENQLKYPVRNAELNKINGEIISCVDDLISFIEIRFPAYLSPDERVPATLLLVIKKELKQRLDKLKANQEWKDFNNGIVDLMLYELYSFMSCSKDEHSFVFREISYVNELVKELEKLNDGKNSSEVYTPLDEMLIYMNFNSRTYMDHLIQRVSKKIHARESISEKIEMLLFYSKEFKQILRKPGVAFNSEHKNIDVTIGGWFTQEIFYLEKKLQYTGALLNENFHKPVHKDNPASKVLCILSVDQMAIILRSVDDLKILKARSLNAVFKTIVPYLSTPSRENISYDSMRSKSYAVETRDKEIVIQTLEQMIQKIAEY